MTSATRDMTYEETIKDINSTLGRIPGFMTFLPREKLVRDWPLWKALGELDFERACCLLCCDSMSETGSLIVSM